MEKPVADDISKEKSKVFIAVWFFSSCGSYANGEIWQGEAAGHRCEETGYKDLVTQAQQLPGQFFCQ